ncbi:MAG: MATE family efflux transporter [Gammaproteobacteria bacterium]|nr:MATE family efflux transporter [Gammaproteobacteria bacterium]MBQ0840946.1 MATE family efflux transporter [Gammaproteobacteria bacterium]
MNTKASQRTQAIVNDPIGRTLFRLTVPMIGGIIALMAVGIVDAYFVGQLGTASLAALGFVLPITHGVNSIGLGLGMATSVLVSRYLGEDRFTQAARQITDGRLLIIGIGIGLLLSLYLGLHALLRLLGASGEVLNEALLFMALWIPVIPLLLLTLTGNTILRAIGCPGKSAFLLALLATLNAGLDPLLIFGFGPLPGLGIGGAALATSIAWIITFLVSHYMLKVQEQLIVKGKQSLQELRANWARLLTIGIPAIFANLMTPLAAAILTAMVARFGTTAVAGFGVSTRIEALCLLIAFSLSSTLPMFIGQNIGAGKPERARIALFGAIRFCLLFQLAMWLLVAAFSPAIGSMFSTNPEVIAIISNYLWIIPASYGAHAVTILVMVSLNAIKQPKTALLTALIRLLLLNIPIAFIGGQLYGINGLFYGFALGNVLSAIVAWRIINRAWAEQVGDTG